MINPSIAVSLHDLDYYPIRASDSHKDPQENHTHMQTVDDEPAHASPPVVLVTIKPQPPRQADRQRRIAETPHQRKDIREDGNGAGQEE